MEKDEVVSTAIILDRFRRLISDLQGGTITHNDFQDWEVEILLDIESLPLEGRLRREILQQYEIAVERQLESGTRRPMRLSEFLILRGRA